MAEEKKQVIIGTAGHVDHGKSSLVKALTGIDPDTLPEEKKRSMTIDLGFVFMNMQGCGREIVFIDVPGHEGLVRTMVAGASSIDAALLVVAADEGIKPQTEEHFTILKLFGIKKGMVVLTKTDMVAASQIEKVNAEIRDMTEGSFLDGEPIIEVSSVSGAGIERLKTALADIAGKVGERSDTGIFRMPIDRIFVAPGFGTVIAGTILSGRVGVGDTVEIFPAGITSKVRGIQVHSRKVQESGTGTRTALNIPDIKKELLKRGQIAAAPGALSPTNRLDAQLQLLGEYPKNVKNRIRLRFHAGTDEVICRLILLDREEMRPGERIPVQFFLESPIAVLAKDRFIVRTFSPVKTIGGGIILDVEPGKHKRFDSRPVDTLKKLEGSLTEAVEEVLLKSRFVPLEVQEIVRQTGESEEKIREVVEELSVEHKIRAFHQVKTTAQREQTRYMHNAAYKELLEKLVETVRDFLRRNPYRLSIPFSSLKSLIAGATDKKVFEELFGELEQKGVIFRKGGGLFLSGYSIKLKAKEQELADMIAGNFRGAGLTPPLEDEIQKKTGAKKEDFQNIMNVLIEQGTLVRLSGKVTYHRDWLEKIEGIVTEYMKNKKSVSISELRDRLDFSRKYAQAVLEYFDETGLTKRDGDRHIPAD